MTTSRGDDKRPIDRVRESALSMQIGGPEDRAISLMIDMGMALYVVKEHAIYAVQLADQVDPGRTNVAVPNKLGKWCWANGGKWCQTFNYLFFVFPAVVVITLSPWRENPEFIIPVRFTM